MKVACILIAHFALKAETQQQPELRSRPVLVVRTEGSRRVVLDFSPPLSGVGIGMPLQKAITFASSASLVEADDVYYSRQFRDILDALSQRGPDVEDAGLGCAYVRLDGLESLYGGDARLVLALQSAVPDWFRAQVGVGSGKFVAYLAALTAEPGFAYKALDDLDSWLARFPVDVLPVSFRAKARLHRFGLHTLGDVARLSIGPMQAQFGPAGRDIWELASGKDSSLLLPRKQEEVVTESLTFTEPVSTIEPILMGAEVLLGRAFLRPETRGRFARLISLEARISRRASWAKDLSFKQPVWEPRQAVTRIKAALEAATLPGPLEDLTLSLRGLTGETGRQTSLFLDIRKKEQIQEALRQLDASLGRQAPVFQVREVEPWSRIPERRHALLPVAR